MKEKMKNDCSVVSLVIADPNEEERDRIVSLDLNEVDDWGDLKCGEDSEGNHYAAVLGENDSSLWPVKRAFQVVSVGDRRHHGKFPMAEELTMKELHEMSLARLERFTD